MLNQGRMSLPHLAVRPQLAVLAAGLGTLKTASKWSQACVLFPK